MAYCKNLNTDTVTFHETSSSESMRCIATIYRVVDTSSCVEFFIKGDFDFVFYLLFSKNRNLKFRHFTEVYLYERHPNGILAR